MRESWKNGEKEKNTKSGRERRENEERERKEIGQGFGDGKEELRNEGKGQL